MSLRLNGINIDVTMFPDNTSQVWKVPEAAFEGKSYNIVWEFSHEGELFHLLQLVQLIRYGHIPRPIKLHMPYLPYGRQDKDLSNDATFALKPFCNLLDTLNLDEITTLDAHSMIAEKWLRNFKNIHPSREISQALRKTNATAIAFPDKGACDRYFGKDETIGHELIIGHKVRDQQSGWIVKYDIEGDPKGRDVLIIDDICDGGMTFKLLAKDLYEQGAASVSLYVTHGIFSKGLRELRKAGIRNIYTKDGELFPSRNTNYLIRRY